MDTSGPVEATHGITAAPNSIETINLSRNEVISGRRNNNKINKNKPVKWAWAAVCASAANSFQFIICFIGAGSIANLAVCACV